MLLYNLTRGVAAVCGGVLLLITATQLQINITGASFCNLLISASIFLALKLKPKSIILIFVVHIILGLLGVPIYHWLVAERSFILGPWGGFILGYFIATYIASFFRRRYYYRIWIIFIVSQSVGFAWLFSIVGDIIFKNSGFYFTIACNLIQTILVTIIIAIINGRVHGK